MRRTTMAVLLLLVVAGTWLALRPGDDQQWLVRGGIDNPNGAVEACNEVPGVDLERSSFYATGDGPVVPGEPRGGVEMVVDTESDADALSACLEDNGVVNLSIEIADVGPPKSFEETGP